MIVSVYNNIFLTHAHQKIMLFFVYYQKIWNFEIRVDEMNNQPETVDVNHLPCNLVSYRGLKGSDKSRLPLYRSARTSNVAYASLITAISVAWTLLPQQTDSPDKRGSRKLSIYGTVAFSSCYFALQWILCTIHWLFTAQ